MRTPRTTRPDDDDPDGPAGQRRECYHPRARHRHGTRTAYTADECRCLPCTAAYLAAARGRAQAIAIGRWQPYQSAQPARDHLAALRAGGLGIERIAELSGVPGSTLRALIHRADDPTARIRTGTAQLILAVNPRTVPPNARSITDATATRRRLQELLDAGHGWTELADRLERNPRSLRRTARRDRVTSATAAAIADLHELLLTPADHHGRPPATPDPPRRQRPSAPPGDQRRTG